jgi:transcription antitermination factor NusG
MPKKEPSRQFKVGDKIKVNLHHGKIEEAVIKAIIERADGLRLQVSVVGEDRTALIEPWQVVVE